MFKIRASASGKIMTNPRAKSELISETTKSYVKEYLISEIYGIKKQINNKYLSKGIWLEDEAIDKAIEWLDIPFALKNEKYFEDDFFCGTPDLILENEVLDIKCSWDAFTFPLFENEIPTKDYYYQLQVYMHLTGKRKARLVYVLLNTPEELLYEEKHSYDNMDKKYRIKTYEIEYSEDVIADLKERVTNIRNYIKKIYNE
jgi:hypothetical protein